VTTCSASADPEWEYALSRVSRCAQTTHQIVQALQKKNVTEDNITRVVNKLIDYDLLNDNEYAASAVRTYQREPGRSRRWIEQWLTTRGIPRDVAHDAVSVITNDDDIQSAVHFLTRKHSSAVTDYLTNTHAPSVRRAYAALQRRGFSSTTISSAFRCAADEQTGGVT